MNVEKNPLRDNDWMTKARFENLNNGGLRCSPSAGLGRPKEHCDGCRLAYLLSVYDPKKDTKLEVLWAIIEMHGGWVAFEKSVHHIIAAHPDLLVRVMFFGWNALKSQLEDAGDMSLDEIDGMKNLQEKLEKADKIIKEQEARIRILSNPEKEFPPIGEKKKQSTSTGNAATPAQRSWADMCDDEEAARPRPSAEQAKKPPPINNTLTAADIDKLLQAKAKQVEEQMAQIAKSTIPALPVESEAEIVDKAHKRAVDDAYKEIKLEGTCTAKFKLQTSKGEITVMCLETPARGKNVCMIHHNLAAE
jgi:hypothetical protein